MLDADRLREWARLLLIHGPDISHWGSVPFVASKMQTLATGIEKAVRDVGTLRASQAQESLRELVDELEAAAGQCVFEVQSEQWPGAAGALFRRAAEALRHQVGHTGQRG